jgi:Ca2+-binding EF-hand superfamily protein
MVRQLNTHTIALIHLSQRIATSSACNRVLCFRAVATNAELIKTFTELDLNGDGQITRTEFQAAMTARGEEITDEEVESIFADADSDHDGQISLTEFTEAWNRAEP